MNIQKEAEKSKPGLAKGFFNLVLPLLIIFLVTIGWWLWHTTHPVQNTIISADLPAPASSQGPFLSKKQNNPQEIKSISTSSPQNYPQTSSQKAFVASSKGHTFYPATCKLAQKIKVSSRIWFASAEEAEKAGLKPSAGCHGQ